VRGDASSCAGISQVTAIRHAHAAGHRVVAVDGDPGAIGFGIADVPVNVDHDLEQVVTTATEHRVDGVLAVSSDRAVVPAAIIAHVLAAGHRG
jgi:hypothetical protein